MTTIDAFLPRLTIFTPAYNRADLLPRLFESIARQVLVGEPVEWLVIDDGSTDDTARVVAAFSVERPDLVRYKHVPNGGKHRAINWAARVSRGDWIMLVDSDDRVVEGAIQEVREQISSIEGDARIGVIRALRRFPDMGVTAHRFNVVRNPGYHWQWISEELAFDTAEVIRRSALVLHPFPDHTGERFMAEGWLWHSLDKSHMTLFVATAWIDCYYQVEGLSANSRRIRAMSPLGAMDVYSQMLSAPTSWQVRVRAAINWWRYRFHAVRRGHSSARGGRPSLVYAPFGWCLSRLDRSAVR